MKLLLDTQILLWAAGMPERLTREARELISADTNMLFFSAASIWEIAIKCGLGRDDLQVEPGRLRRGLVGSGYREIAITGEHALAVLDLPPLHKDPFDRLIVAQATIEGLTLLTADPTVARYPGSVRMISPNAKGV